MLFTNTSLLGLASSYASLWTTPSLPVSYKLVYPESHGDSQSLVYKQFWTYWEFQKHKELCSLIYL